MEGHNMSTMIKLSDIKPFPRDGIDNERVNRYAKILKSGIQTTDPVVVFHRDGESQYELYHGRHMYYAHVALNRAEISVVFVGAPIRPDSRAGSRSVR